MPFTDFIQPIAGAVGTGLGLLLEKHNDARQIRQQGELTKIQLNANKSMAEFNQQQAFEMWQKTNYPAQMAMLKNAGLNPGLLYGMGGAGGATTSGGTGQGVSGASGPMGGGEIMGIMNQQMQLAIMKAQKENIEADTANKTAQNPNIPITGENIQADTAAKLQGVQNAKAQQALTEVHTKIAETEAKLKDATLQNAINMVQLDMQNLDQLRIKMVRDNWIGQETMNTQIKTIQADYIRILVENELKRAQTNLTDAGTLATITEREQNIKRTAAQVAQGWDKIGVDMHNANTGEARQRVEAWVNDVQNSTKLGADIIEKILQAVTLRGLLGTTPQRNPIGFKP